MYLIKSKVPIIVFFFFFPVLLIQMGCMDVTEWDFQPVPDEPDLHIGWHDSMSGKILFTSRYSEGGGAGIRDHLFVTDKDGLNSISLPDNTGYIDGGIEWSPDGSKITFGNYNNGLFVMENDGTNTFNIYDEHSCRSPSWSPDGASIACIVRRQQIMLIDHESGDYSNFNFEYNTLQTLDWSPTGTRITFDYGFSVGASSFLKILDVSDSTIIEIRDSHSLNLKPVWSPDGKKIAFAQTYISAGYCIFTVNADGSDINDVIYFADYNLKVICRDLAWSPDGKMIAAGVKDGIYVIDLYGNIITKIATNGECYNLDWR